MALVVSDWVDSVSSRCVTRFSDRQEAASPAVVVFACVRRAADHMIASILGIYRFFAGYIKST
jgi:hypothetical protein